MTTDEFWTLIETANDQSQGDMDHKCKLVERAVSSLSPEAAAEFSMHFDEAMNRAYSWDLWGAAYVMNGGCGDDTFSDFRSSLISRGRDKFEAAIATPDSLAAEPFDEESWFYEGFQYAVYKGVEAVISPQEQSVVASPTEPSGSPWEEDPDVLKERYPLLWTKFESIWSIQKESPNQKPKLWWKFW